MASFGKKRVVIIGAGVGGTATAAYLAQMGHEVLVLEKNDFVGGRCSLIHNNGHRFDQGPSFYLMPEVFEEAFRDLGEDVRDHVKLHQCKPNYRVYYHDGEVIELSSDMTHMKQVLEKYEIPAGNPQPFKKFLEFMHEAHDHYEVSVRDVLKKDYQHWYQTFRLRWISKAIKMKIHRTLYPYMSQFFKSDHIRRAVTFASMYLGMSPFDAPATYNLLQYTEYAQSIWYPEGGFATVPMAFMNIAQKKFDAKFRFNAPISKIRIGITGKVEGVELESGEFIAADAVVSNADLVYTYDKLLPPSRYAKSLTKKEFTCSSISFYWSLSRQLPEMDAHNLFIAEKYRESFDQIFLDHTIPDDPSFYVHTPSRVDPSAAPPGKDTLVVLIPTGTVKIRKETWEQDRAKYQETIKFARKMAIETIEKRTGIKNLESLIEAELYNDPWAWNEKFNLFSGSILGLSHTIRQVLWFRPSITHSKYNNMFFVGASAHPGTGVPVVVCGSKITAQHVNAYLTGVPIVDYAKYEAMFVLLVLSMLLLSLIVWVLGGTAASCVIENVAKAVNVSIPVPVKQAWATWATTGWHAEL
ncbi:hypothetical protein M422DRAFT_217164 [Sphaerobolus stellatus SS14]|uniref:Phytoene desaturase n=1 Tax=Sphaerobolus stellatus (strain SS14) TaxID=990650 RepID=A0A0C9U5Z9_SPHS4|nr:hypothetical protein M422DRAFT_217164 [Sphaerobolus stellatus SS14]